LEKTFACNRNQINKEFQKELNTTVMKYFTQMRMQLASILLRDTEIPILEVALRVGIPMPVIFPKHLNYIAVYPPVNIVIPLFYDITGFIGSA